MHIANHKYATNGLYERKVMKKLILVLAGILLIGVSASGFAAPVVITNSSGTLFASASFEVIGTNLQVTLTNTSIYDVAVPSNVLTALFFTYSGPTLTPESAYLGSGSLVYYDPDGQPADGNVGGEWAYNTGLSGAPLGATSGISSSGFGLFGDANFNGANLAKNDALDGLQYGILSAGDDSSTGNGGITGSGGLIKDSVVFTLSGFPAGNDPTGAISNVSFQYGTSLNEPNVPVPEPGTLILLGSGLIGLAGYGRKKYRK